MHWLRVRRKRAILGRTGPLCRAADPNGLFWQVYLEERGHELMDDDTTVLVVELNPSGVKVAPPGGCCSVQ